jgi:nicotinamidase-related amidase
MQNILLVIDMQNCYVNKESVDLIHNVQEEISCAMRDRDQIIFLEYTDSGGNMRVKDMTLLSLLDMIGEYQYAHLIRKGTEDGSEEVVEFLKTLDADVHFNIRVVGVETECCFAQTVNSISEMLPSSILTVVGQACKSGYASRDEPPSNDGLDSIDLYDNVRIEWVTNPEHDSRCGRRAESSLECI